jgi:uncharacterized LabA/DUF88 family protein
MDTMNLVKHNQRTAVLVDVQNLFYSAKALTKGAKVDYNKLLNGLGEGRQLVQRPDVSQGNFIEALTRIGFDIRVKEVKNRTDGDGKVIPTKGNYEGLIWDDAIKLAPKMDTFIIVSGDGGLAPLIKTLSVNGCRVEVAAFDNAVSGELMKVADGFIPIRPEWTFVSDKQTKVEVEVPEVLVEEPESEFDEKQPVSYASALGIFGKK